MRIGRVGIAVAFIAGGFGCADDRQFPLAETRAVEQPVRSVDQVLTSDTSTSLPPSTTAPKTPMSAPFAATSLGVSRVTEALAEARDRWLRAGIASYRLTVTEGVNFSSAGCVWDTVVSGGEVTQSDVESTSVSGDCTPANWTVEQLHRVISDWIDTATEYSAPEFGEHLLQVQFDEIGVPVAMRFDLANGLDEESSKRVILDATGTSDPQATSTPLGEPLVEPTVVHESPGQVFVAHLPAGYAVLHEQTKSDDESSTFVSVAYGNGGQAPRLIITMTRGVDANAQLSLDGVADPVEREEVAGLRAEAVVYRWTDSLTQQRGFAWAADPVTVIWVYASKLSDEFVADVISTLEVSPP